MNEYGRIEFNVWKKYGRNISNISLQLKYCRKITILTFWNNFKNK